MPMAFYKGEATPAIVTMLRQGGQFRFAGCRGSIGVELPANHTVTPGYYGGLPVRPRNGQRAYFFLGAGRWSPEFLSKAQKEVLP